VLANLRNLAVADIRAATDGLTGLPNKRFAVLLPDTEIDEALEIAIASATPAPSANGSPPLPAPGRA
jgi:GGDEF domain-containing protein